MGIPYLKPEEEIITFDQYLLMEEEAEYKSEYHEGKILKMSGGTARHSGIAQNTGTAISNELRKNNKKCRVYNSDLKVRIELRNRGVYPDLSVVCNQLEYYKNRKDIYLNPLLIVEVLSKSTKNYDSGEKFRLYRTLPSFKEYLLIYQDQPKIEAWHKMEENVWQITNVAGLDQTLPLYSLDCEILLSDIYYLYEDF